VRFVVGFAVLAIVFGAIEWRWPARAQRRLRRGWRTDVVYFVVAPFASRAFAFISVAVIAIVLALATGTRLDRASIDAFVHRATWFGDLPRAAQIALVLVVGDFFAYWLHRAFHRGRLWRFHAVHHSSTELDWLASTRGHPVNDVVQRSLQGIALLALGFDPTVVAVYVPALALYAVALHANVTWSFGPLRYAIASPTFHRWHHTSEAEGLDKNFAGLFPFWDLVFGTFYMPRGEVPSQFGVRDDVPDGIVGQLAWPFRRDQRARAATTAG